MNNSDLQRIKHMKNYCEDVARTVERFGEDYETFLADKDYFNSVSMSIMQVGELSIGLTDEFKRWTGGQVQWGAIRGMRNMYAHTYAKMDKLTIWQTATLDMPGLLHFCEGILEQERGKKEPSDNKASVLQQLVKDKKTANQDLKQQVDRNGLER